MKEKRLSSAELQQLQEDAARKEAEERHAREEKKKQHQEVNRTKDMEQVLHHHHVIVILVSFLFRLPSAQAEGEFSAGCKVGGASPFQVSHHCIL